MLWWSGWLTPWPHINLCRRRFSSIILTTEDIVGRCCTCSHPPTLLSVLHVVTKANYFCETRSHRQTTTRNLNCRIDHIIPMPTAHLITASTLTFWPNFLSTASSFLPSMVLIACVVFLLQSGQAHRPTYSHRRHWSLYPRIGYRASSSFHHSFISNLPKAS